MRNFVLSVFVLSLLLVSCGKSEKKAADTDDHTNTAETESLKDVVQNNWIKTIKLDNGKKWKANPESNEGVNNMLRYISEANLKSIEDYRALAIKLSNEKNYVIKECTMDGPAHDNLHVFLLPLVEKIDYLSKVDDVTTAKKVVNSIEENLKAYADYFE